MTSPGKLPAWFARRWLAVTVVIAAGLLLLRTGLDRASYDIPFCLAYLQSKVPDDLVLVYLDSKVKLKLGQPPDVPLSRRFYTRLLDRATREGARLVVFDIIFDSPAADPAVDAAFASAIRANGHVVLVADYTTQIQGSYLTTSPIPPITPLENAALAWGTALVYPDAADLAVRKISPGAENCPSLSWAAAKASGAAITEKPGNQMKERWLNYYCSPKELHDIDLDVALDGAPEGFFKDKIVFVGARPGVGAAGAERETFPSPYGRIGGADASGPSIQAFSFLNLIHHDWMEELSLPIEGAIVAIWGFLIAITLMSLRPWKACFAGVGCFAGFTYVAALLQLHTLRWFPWLVPAAAQTSVALVWSVGYQYLVESRRRKKLRQAFGAYLSPYMADRISNSEFNLSLGGKEVEATVMFTDLEGFTKMSETLPPSEVSHILTSYFNHTTRAILEQDGTIIKYIGDAVMAVWGAPLPDPRHAERAVLAAWAMSQASQDEIAGRRLRTRIGVNTGLVLAGNLGSEFRFDYTLIGDTTNFASRLEGLNKYLHTNVLISESTHRQIGKKIKVRPVGRFLVVGKAQSVAIYEVLGPVSDSKQNQPWLEAFEKGLQLFSVQQWDEAEKQFRETISLRGGRDGPAEFYLAEMPKYRAHPGPNPSWDGSILLDSK